MLNKSVFVFGKYNLKSTRNQMQRYFNLFGFVMLCLGFLFKKIKVGMLIMFWIGRQKLYQWLTLGVFNPR